MIAWGEKKASRIDRLPGCRKLYRKMEDRRRKTVRVEPPSHSVNLNRNAHDCDIDREKNPRRQTEAGWPGEGREQIGKPSVFKRFSVLVIHLLCEVIKKKSQGTSDGICQTAFVLKCCMSRGRSLSGHIRGWELGASPPPLLTVLLLRYSF